MGRRTPAPPRCPRLEGSRRRTSWPGFIPGPPQRVGGLERPRGALPRGEHAAKDCAPIGRSQMESASLPDSHARKSRRRRVSLCVRPTCRPTAQGEKRGCQGSRGQKAGGAVAAPRAGLGSTALTLFFFRWPSNSTGVSSQSSDLPPASHTSDRVCSLQSAHIACSVSLAMLRWPCIIGLCIIIS